MAKSEIFFFVYPEVVLHGLYQLKRRRLIGIRIAIINMWPSDDRPWLVLGIPYLYDGLLVNSGPYFISQVYEPSGVSQG